MVREENHLPHVIMHFSEFLTRNSLLMSET